MIYLADDPEKRKAYYRAYYANHKGDYARISKKYRSTKLGQLTNKKSVQNFITRYPDYYKQYSKERRIKLKQEGKCSRCAVNFADKPFSLCTKCKEYSRAKYASETANILENNAKKIKTNL